ncbi:unnamed protein product [Calicophoron daubneyi]|uniref:Peptidoglycan-recognition protein n=1 Tax=Calicophoron daubneyi TaxID=300641 RepID=A0AAV2TYH7_CALDB
MEFHNCEVCTLVLMLMAVSFASDLRIVAREEWNASDPTEIPECLQTPVPYVFVHHTYEPEICFGDECKRSVRNIQTFHMKVRGWSDIGYTFLIGGDGIVYEGRGWGVVGAHTYRYNKVGYGLCLIGDYRKDKPTEESLESLKQLIELGVSCGQIRTNYTLLGHRDVGNTECPGDALYKEIQTWEHFNLTNFIH